MSHEYKNNFGVYMSGEVFIEDSKDVEYPLGFSGTFKVEEYKLVCIQHDDVAEVKINGNTFVATGDTAPYAGAKISCWPTHLP